MPWVAAFLVGTEAGSVGIYKGKPLNKAQFRHILVVGKKPH